MTDREKLIELLDEMQHQGNSTKVGCNYVFNNEIADHLLANGVIVPPCKVGDTVYKYDWKYSECHLGITPPYRPCFDCEGCCSTECDTERTLFCYDGVVTAFRIDKNGVSAQIAWNGRWDTSWYDIGKTVFLTSEEDEAKLKEGQR